MYSPLLHSIKIGLVVLLLGFLLPTQASATHLMGSDLSYKCLGNNQYELTLTVYRDCKGIDLFPQTWVDIKSTSCQYSTTSMLELEPGYPIDVTSSCPGQVSYCQDPTLGQFGFEQWVYKDTVTLIQGCSNWQFSWSMCCRNGATTSLNTPLSEQMYIETTLDNNVVACNQSPVFTNIPTPIFCINQNVSYNQGAVDPDGDSLVFSLTNCRDASGQSVGYGAGFSATNPLQTTNGLQIDPQTGALSFTPNALQIGVVCVLVEEFRNGQKVGETVRDMQFSIVNCTNQAPQASGVNNTAIYADTVMANTQICFDIYSSDPDNGQTVSMQWNNTISGALFVVDNQSIPVGTFCWTPSLNDVGTHSFTVEVEDDACPLPGSNTFTYVIVVLPPPSSPCDSILVQVDSTANILCTPNSGVALISVTGGMAPFNFQVVNWSTGDFYSSTTGTFLNLAPGSYGVWVSDANGCTPNCSNSSFEITAPAGFSPLTASLNAQDIACPINSQAYTGLSGVLDIQANGGTAPYTYYLNGMAYSNNVITSLPAGNYTVDVIDANGCSIQLMGQIQAPAPFVVQVLTAVAPQCGSSDGEIEVLATGGAGNYSFTLNGQTQFTGSFSQLAAGTYDLTVNSQGCTYDTTIVLQGGPAVIASARSTAVSCFGDCDGVLSAYTSGGTAPFSFNWADGSTDANRSNLCAGSYALTVTDANGCEWTGSFDVTEPDPVQLILSSTTDESCTGNDGAAILTATGGTAPFDFQIANFTTSQSQNNTTGQFNQLNAGNHSVQVIDANGCGVECPTTFILSGCQKPSFTNNSGSSTISTVGSPSTVNSLGSKQMNITISPNPANAQMRVVYSTQATGPMSIEIRDELGQSVEQRHHLEQEGRLVFQTGNWASATYTLIIKNKVGQILGAERFIIRH